MGKVSLSDIKLLFRKVIIPFHEIERDMTLPLPSHRPDNDAEHSWSLSMLAISLAPEIDKTLDVGKVAIFSIVHDIVEIHAGDTSVWSPKDTLDSKKEREATAKQKLKVELPNFPTVLKFLDQYDAGNSNEAKFVYALDKFINMLTVIEDEGYFYRVKYKITKDHYDRQLKSHRAKAYVHPLIGSYYDELRELFDKNPDNFYIDK